MKIVHLADLHLGFRAYNRLDKNGINIREKDVLRAFNEALEKIAKINPDLILIAGDIFHRPRPSNLSIHNTILLLQKFRQQCQSPIIMIAGNHEAVKSLETGSVLKIFESVISNVKIVDSSIEELPVEKLDTSVLCIPHGGLSQIEQMDLRPNKDFKYNVMVIHGTYGELKEIAGYGNGAVIKDEDIHRSEWDYIAFGHYHIFTELAPNAFYAGGIERTTTNIWQESKDKKGFIEFDLDTKTCYFHSLETPRKVIDIKKIDAANMAAEEINQVIADKVAGIKELEKTIVRLTIENIDPVAMRSLDYKKIRELKKTAVHFRTNFIKKDFSGSKNDNQENVAKKKGILEYLEEELEQFELSQGLDKEKFAGMAKEYLNSEIGA